MVDGSKVMPIVCAEMLIGGGFAKHKGWDWVVPGRNKCVHAGAPTLQCNIVFGVRARGCLTVDGENLNSKGHKTFGGKVEPTYAAVKGL